MTRNHILKAAILLWAFTAASAGIYSGRTLAKYVSSASVEAGARVAKWDVFEQFEMEAPCDPPVHPGEEDDVQVNLTYDPTVTGDFYFTTIELENRSEVTARYYLETSFESWEGIEEPEVEVSYMDGTPYDPEEGVVLSHLGGTVQMKVRIPKVTFKGLEIKAYAEQVD